MQTLRIGWVLAALLAATGCDDDGGTALPPGTGGDAGTGAAGTSGAGGLGGGGAGGGGPVLRGPCALSQKVGFFQVQHEPDYSAVSGEVNDGVVPIKVLDQVASEGDCVLLQRNNPFCDPPCGPSETCDHDGSCIPYPLPKSGGQVSISGLNKAVELQPPSYFDTQMPHPGFDPGAAIVLSAAGDEVGGFTLVGAGFAPVELSSGAWLVEAGEPLEVTWTAEAAGPARILLRLNIDQHGNSPVQVFCDLPDTGTATVPASLVDELLGFGVSGFPSGDLFRRTVDSVTIEYGCVEFLVFSHRQATVQVAGHIPCNDPDDCPPPLTCDLPTNTCI